MLLLHAKLRATKDIETKLQITCFYIMQSFFKKTKRSLELIFLPHFQHEFWWKIYFLLYTITWPSFVVWLPLLREILGNTCIIIACKPGCDVINFEIKLKFIIKPSFPNNQNVKANKYANKYIHLCIKNFSLSTKYKVIQP